MKLRLFSRLKAMNYSMLRSSRRLFSALGGLLFCFACGCDLTGAYGMRRAEIGNKLQNDWAVMKDLGSRSEIPDVSGNPTGVTVCLPEIFGKKVRFQPLPTTMPNLKGIAGVCEAPDNQGGGPMMLVGAFEAAIPLDQAIQGIGLVAATFAPGVAGQRSDLSSEGTTPDMTLVSYVGNQRLLRLDPMAAGNVAPGRTDIYIVSTAKHHVVFVFRVSDEVNLAKNFQDIMSRSMKTVMVPEVAAAPAEAPAAPMPMGS